MNTFNTKEAAIAWVVDHVDDACVDNERFAFVDDEQAMIDYDAKKEDGCCGSFDGPVRVGGKLAVVGCNYGH